jgi:ABC-type dipeptide/oligopeptide/nickel transport system permease component
VCISILTTALLFGANFLFQKYVIKEINKRKLSTLAVFDFSVLLILSVSAVLNYYIGISGEIDHYHKIVSP